MAGYEIHPAELDSLVAAVHDSSRNRNVCPDVIRRFGEQEMSSQSSMKSAVKETKNRLHQSAGAYIDKAPNYVRWRNELAAAADMSAICELSQMWMQSHSSTRERLPFLKDFYSTTLKSIGSISSVIDIACGLNPLAMGWMGLASDVRYDGYDIYSDMASFLTGYFKQSGVNGAVSVSDCAAAPPEQAADLALILKFLPVLEQARRGGTLEWLKRINAQHMLLSFPTRSLGGKGKGMAQNYETRFLETVSKENWGIEKYEFANELCFLVRR